MEGWVRNIRGTVRLHLGEFGTAAEDLTESLRLYREVGDRRGEGWDLCFLARLLRQRGRYEEAEGWADEAGRVLRAIDERMGWGYALHIRARIRLDRREEDSRAEAEARESLAVQREIRCGIGAACALSVLALPLLRRGEGGEAREMLAEALGLRREGGFRRGESRSLARLAWADLLLGNPPGAEREAREAVGTAREVESPATLAGALTILGRVLLESRDLSAAEAAFREAQEIRERLGQFHLLTEPMAGRIVVARLRGDAAAAALRGRISPDGDGGFPYGAEDPGWVREIVGGEG
jgi:tetratricopeptide (TPR) repeat protein